MAADLFNLVKLCEKWVLFGKRRNGVLVVVQTGGDDGHGHGDASRGNLGEPVRNLHYVNVHCLQHRQNNANGRQAERRPDQREYQSP